jgi:hypothetical protein
MLHAGMEQVPMSFACWVMLLLPTVGPICRLNKREKKASCSPVGGALCDGCGGGGLRVVVESVSAIYWVVCTLVSC